MTDEDYGELIWGPILEEVSNERLKEVIAAICDVMKAKECFGKKRAIKGAKLAIEVAKITGERPSASAMAKAIKILKTNKYSGFVSFPKGYYIENTYNGDLLAALFDARNICSRIRNFSRKIEMLREKYKGVMLPDDPEDFCNMCKQQIEDNNNDK